MAAKGSRKQQSRLHEAAIAKAYGGRVSPSSGASLVDQGDVRTARDLIECKMRGAEFKPAKSISVQLAVMEKIADEAYMDGLDPAIALRLYAPDSPLAQDGYVDMIVRLVKDDIHRG